MANFKLFGAKDMTTGTPWKKLVEFSIPLLIGNFAQQLYNTADSVVVGKYVGKEALAAVGTSMPILNLLLVFFMGISTGTGIMVSQYFGAKKRDELSRTVGTCMMLTLYSSLLVMVLGFFVSRPLLVLLKTPPEIIDMAATYLQIIFLGIVAMSFYNIVAGILRGLGDSVTPLLFLMLACALNIVLDILFVASFGWGVAGVAIATVIAQAVSAVLCIIRLTRMNDVVRMDRTTLRVDGKLAAKVARLGMPSGLTQAIFSMAMILVQSLTNTFGVDVIATVNIVMRVDGFVIMPNFTFGMAMTTFAGQNIGAGRIDRVERGTRDGLMMGMGVAAVLTVLILLFGRPLMGLFVNPEEADSASIINMAMHQMRIVAAGYIAFAASQILSGVMRGAGDTMPPMWIALINTVIVRVPIAYLMAHFTRSAAFPNGSPDSLYYSLLVSWTVNALMTFFWFRRGTWRNKSVVRAGQVPDIEPVG